MFFALTLFSFVCFVDSFDLCVYVCVWSLFQLLSVWFLLSLSPKIVWCSYLYVFFSVVCFCPLFCGVLLIVVVVAVLSSIDSRSLLLLLISHKCHSVGSILYCWRRCSDFVSLFCLLLSVLLDMILVMVFFLFWLSGPWNRDMRYYRYDTPFRAIPWREQHEVRSPLPLVTPQSPPCWAASMSASDVSIILRYSKLGWM